MTSQLLPVFLNLSSTSKISGVSNPAPNVNFLSVCPQEWRGWQCSGETSLRFPDREQPTAGRTCC
jgi:hypothetical protein